MCTRTTCSRSTAVSVAKGEPGTFDEGGGGTKAADSGTLIRHFDFVVVVYEIGEDGKSERTWKWYLAQVQRMYKVHEKGGKPTKYMDPVALGEAGVHLRVKLLSEAAVERAGSSLRDPCCFMLEGHGERGARCDSNTHRPCQGIIQLGRGGGG